MKPKRKKDKSSLIIWSVLLLEFILLLFLGFIFNKISQSGLNAMPEQTAQVEVAKKQIYEKRSGSPQYLVHFKFKDSIKKIFIVDIDTYETIKKGETGTLFYKELQPNKNEEDRIFIRFEKAPPG